MSTTSVAITRPTENSTKQRTESQEEAQDCQANQQSSDAELNGSHAASLVDSTLPAGRGWLAMAPG